MNSRRLAVAAVSAATLGMPAAAQAGPYDTAVRADDPLIYLRMEEAPGASTALDSSAYGRHGTYLGAALGAAGPFIDAGAAVTLPKAGNVTATVPETSGSAELWIKPQRLKRGEQAGFLSHGDPSGDGWALGVGPKRKLAFVSGGKVTTTRVTIPSGVWTMVDATWTATQVRVYVNGEFAKAVTRNDSVPTSSRADLMVGGNGAGAFGGALAGGVDEVALYRQVLTPEQVAAHRAAASLPTNTAAPVVGGTLQVGETLSVAAGTWSGAVAPYAYQWQRCDADQLDCDDIDGATGATYTLVAADEGMTLQVIETATNASGASSAMSAPTGVVAGLPGGGDGGGGTTDPGTGGGDGGGGTTDPGTGGGGTTDPGTGGGTTDPGTGTTGTGTGTTGTGTTGTTGTGTTDTTGTGTGTTGTGTGGLKPRTSSAGTCLQVTRVRKGRGMRRVGRLRLQRSTACVRAGAPLRLKLRVGKAKSVRMTLDGKRVKATVRRGTAKAALKAPRLRPGRHVLKIRVKARGGKARTVRVRIVTARR